MTLIFAIGTIFTLSILYAIAITQWQMGLRFAKRVDWMAFSLGELMVIGVVQLMGSADAITLLVLHLAGAIPMALRWFYLWDTQERRQELRTLYADTKQVADRSGDATD